MKKRFGIFGGSFDPVHLGHVALVKDLMQKASLDHVFIVPAQISPFKHKTQASPSDRLIMTKLAFRSVPNIEVSDIELKRPGPSYTIDTVRQLKSEDRERGDWYLLMGADSLHGFSKWKEFEALLQEIDLLVGRRPFTEISLTGFSSDVQDRIRKGIVESALFDVSATMIRKKLQKGEDCSHLLDPAVLSYIQTNKLYK